MNDFTLTPSPALLDADPVTTEWPMPPVRKWEPLDQSLAARFARWADALFGLSVPGVAE